MVNCLKVKRHPSVTLISLKNVSCMNYKNFFQYEVFILKNILPTCLAFPLKEMRVIKAGVSSSVGRERGKYLFSDNLKLLTGPIIGALHGLHRS